MLFPTITPEHWRLELARARATPNDISEQIKHLCRGSKQADQNKEGNASAAFPSGQEPALGARTLTPAVAGELTADAIGARLTAGTTLTHAADGVASR